MKKKIYFAVMAAVTAAALCMTGCGDTEETAGTTAEETTTEELAATAEVTEAAETTGTEEAATEATEAAPEVTFAEENGMEYSDERTFAISGAGVFVDENVNQTEYEGMSIVNYESTFTFGEATVSEPDSDGMVTITLNATVSIPFDVLYDWSAADYPDWRYAAGYSGPRLFDTYTGLAFDSSTFGNDASVAAATDITYDGVTYTVTVAKDVEWNFTYGEWEDYSDTVSRLAVAAEVQETYTITVPQDYDGLCFAFWPVHEYEYGSAGENTASIEKTLEESLAEDGYTLDDVAAYVKVSDLLAE